MSSKVKQAVADALAAYISSNVPALAGAVVGGWSDSEDVAKFPSAAVLPERLTLNPFQEDEADDSDPNVVVVSVGELEGDTTFRLYCSSVEQRGDVEQAVQDLFFGTEGAPGRLIVDAGPVALNVQGSPYQTYSLDHVRATFLLDDESWSDEMVFSKKRYTYLTLHVTLECYIARAVPYIDELIIALQADASLDLSAPAPTSPTDPRLESLVVPS